MSLRQRLNEKSGLTTTITLAVTVLAVAYLVWQVTASDPAIAPRMGFYTDDDGKTFFEAPVETLPPFDHEGKQAVRAFVFTCDEGTTTFIGYMERYTSDVHAKVNAAGSVQNVPDSVFAAGAEIKRPGDTSWVKRYSPEGLKAAQVQCPDGKGELRLLN